MEQASAFDVAVYGATAGGVLAAIAAAQEGANVALLEPGRHVGGMVSGGLGRTDYNERRDRSVIGGLAH
jgi:flavin-dependent dehydrogenase